MSDQEQNSDKGEKLTKYDWYCDKCYHKFNVPDGKQYSDGSIDQWCPSCGCSDDNFVDLSCNDLCEECEEGIMVRFVSRGTTEDGEKIDVEQRKCDVCDHRESR